MDEFLIELSRHFYDEHFFLLDAIYELARLNDLPVSWEQQITAGNIVVRYSARLSVMVAKEGVRWDANEYGGCFISEETHSMI